MAFFMGLDYTSAKTVEVWLPGTHVEYYADNLTWEWACIAMQPCFQNACFLLIW